MPKQKTKSATETALLLRVEVLERNLAEAFALESSLRAEIVQRNERIVEEAARAGLYQASAKTLELIRQTATKHGYGSHTDSNEAPLVEWLGKQLDALYDAVRLHHAEKSRGDKLEKELAAAKSNCNEQTERAEASRLRADAALQEAAEARARAYKAEGGLFACWLATILMTGAAIAMGGILLWGS